MKWSLLIFYFLFSVGFVHSQDTDLADSLFSFNINLDSIVVTPKENKVSAISYDRLEIKENKISSVPRIDQYLNFLPGIEMQSGALNTNRIHIRGIGSRTPFATNKIRAYLDDLPLTDGIGETSIEDINLSFIENIEVWKGPFRSAYGSQLGGAIRYRTLSDFSKIGSTGVSNNTVGDYGYFRTDNSITLKSENHLLLINHEVLRSDGYRDNNKYNKQNANVLYKYLDRKRTITGIFSHIDLRAQIPSSLNINDFISSPSSAAENWKGVEGYEDSRKTRMGINLNQYLNNKVVISSSLLGYAYNAFEVRPFNVLDDNSLALSIRNRINVKSSSFSLELGQEWYREDYEWDIFETIDGGPGAKIQNNTSTRTISNIFTEIGTTLGSKLDIGLGIHYSYLAIDLIQESIPKSKKRYDPIWSPRLYAAYNIKRGYIFRFDAAHGYSNVGLDESLNSDGTFNTEINREDGWNYEIGLRLENISNVNASFSLFRMHVDNIIVNRQDNEGRSFGVNAGSSIHKGIEWSINYSLLNQQHSHINLINNTSIGSYTFENFIDNGVDFTGNKLTGVASTKTNTRLSIKHHSTAFLFWYRYTGSIPVNDSNTISSDAYSLLGFRLAQGIKISSFYLEISAEMDNILDELYASMIAVNAAGFGNSQPRYYYPGLPRNTKVSMTFKYHL